MRSVAGVALENPRRNLLSEANAELQRRQRQIKGHLQQYQHLVYYKQIWCVRKFIRHSAVAKRAWFMDYSWSKLGNGNTKMSKCNRFFWSANCEKSSTKVNAGSLNDKHRMLRADVLRFRVQDSRISQLLERFKEEVAQSQARRKEFGFFRSPHVIREMK